MAIETFEVAWSGTLARDRARADQHPAPVAPVRAQGLRAIIAEVLQTGGEWSCYAMAQRTGLTSNQVNGAFYALRQAGRVTRAGNARGGRFNPLRYRWIGDSRLRGDS